LSCSAIGLVLLLVEAEGDIKTSFVVKMVGLSISILGFAYAYWARAYLASMWSGNIEVRSDQELITSGPYAACRHPIYGGFIIAVLGYLIIHPSIRSLLGASLEWFVMYNRGRIEEILLVQHFKEKYIQYRNRTYMLIPYVV